MTTEMSIFMVISKGDFRQCLADHPDIALSLIKSLSHRMRLLTENVRSLALMDVYGGVAKALLSLAQPGDGKLIISDGLTQQEIANRVGASCAILPPGDTSISKARRSLFTKNCHPHGSQTGVLILQTAPR